MAETEAKSWYDTGYSGVKREQTKIEQQYGPNRMWIPGGGKREIVFVDDEPTAIHEHSPKIDGDWKNWYTCLDNVYDDVACCELLNPSGYKPYYVGYYTVIDCSEWIDKKGTKYQYEVKFFPAKLKTLKRLEMRRKERGPFAGKLFSIMRVDDKSPAVGDEFEIVRDVDMSKLFALANYKGKKLSELYAKATTPEEMEKLQNIFKVDVLEGIVQPKLVPFNYYKLLHPMSPKDIRLALKGAHIEARDDNSGGFSGGTKSPAADGTSGADEDIPF